MKTTAERLENNQVKVKVTIPKEEVNKFVAQAYKEVGKYKIAGFRPGKAPRKVLDTHFGKEGILGEATNFALGTYEAKVVEAENISALGDPEYKDVKNVEEGKDYTYEVVFNVKPEFELTSYDPVSIEVPPAEATDAEVEEQLDRFKEYYSSFETSKSKRMIKKNDFVSLDIKGDEKASFLDREDFLYHIGAGTLPETFDKEIIGMKPGQEKEFDFAVDNPSAEDEGASLHVTVKVNALKDRVEPELNDEFAKDKLGFETLAELRDSVKQQVESEKARMLPEIRETNAIHALGKRLEDEIPENYKRAVFEDLLRQLYQSLQEQGMTLDYYLQVNGITPQQFQEDLQRQADDVARESLALDALAKHLKLEVTTDDILQEFESAGVKDANQTMAEFKEGGRLPSIRDYIRRTKAIEWLVENAKVTEVDMVARNKEEKAAEKKADKKAADKPAKKKSTKKTAKKEEKTEE